MKIFLDTADVAEIREYAASGLVDGVTTNPSLAAKTGRDYVESLKEICPLVPGAVSGPMRCAASAFSVVSFASAVAPMTAAAPVSPPISSFPSGGLLPAASCLY